MSPEEHGADLQRFADYRPTAFDCRGLGSEGQEDWRVLPVVLTRDSGPLDESNIEAAEKWLDDAGADYERHRFGHWGPGWLEIIVVRPDPIGLRVAGEIACALESYPVLDDGDHSERECEAAHEAWLGCQRSDLLWSIEREAPLVADLIADYGLDDLYRWVVESSPGYGYEAGHPYWDAPDMTRDEMAQLARQIRRRLKEERNG